MARIVSWFIPLPTHHTDLASSPSPFSYLPLSFPIKATVYTSTFKNYCPASVHCICCSEYEVNEVRLISQIRVKIQVCFL